MKSGSQHKPVTLSARPPGAGVTARTPEQVVEDLRRVDGMTEEPARAAAAALGVAEARSGAGEGGDTATVEAPAPAPQPKGKPKAVLPWEEVDDNAVISFNFKLPAKLGKKLKFLGDTTYGESMTSILIDCLEPRVNKLLRERGLL